MSGPIPTFTLDKMYEYVDVNKQDLHNALRAMGPHYLKPQFKPLWVPEIPTTGYCYTVCEYIFWSLSDSRDINRQNAEVCYCKVKSFPNMTHTYLRFRDNTPALNSKIIIDLTADQFPDWSDVDYVGARRGFFIQSGKKGPSKRAELLSVLVNVERTKRLVDERMLAGEETGEFKTSFTAADAREIAEKFLK